jgi:SSS family transporter
MALIALAGLTLHPADLLTFSLYLLSISLIGWWAGRRSPNTVETSSGYFLAGRTLPWYVVGSSYIAANISSEHFIGMIGAAMIYGICVATPEWSCIIAFTFLIWVFIPFLVSARVYTAPEYMEKRFNSGMRLFFASVTVIANVVAFLAPVIYGGGLALNSLLGWDLAFCIALIGITSGVWAIWGGLRSVAWMDLLTIVIMILGGLTVTYLGLIALGNGEGLVAGFHEMVTRNQAQSGIWKEAVDRLTPSIVPGHTSYNRLSVLQPLEHETTPWPHWVLSFFYIGLWYLAINQFMVQRILAARDMYHARMGIVFAGYLKLLLPFIVVVPGLIYFAMHPETRDVLLATRRTTGLTNPLWELNFGRRPAEELYSLRDDPDNVRNLAGRSEFATWQTTLRERLFHTLRTQGDPRLTGEPDDYFDRFPFAHPEFNDLYERWETGTLKLPHWADPEPKPLADASFTPPRGGLTHVNDLSVHDPAILADATTQTYYIYANYSPRRTWDLTQLRSPHGRAGVKAWKSKDLILWEGPELVFEVPEDFWADKLDAPWAPEVHAWRGKYYLFVTFNDWETTLETRPGRPPITRRASQILVGDSPLGPFKPFRNAPHTPPGEMTLDGTFYVDEKGDPWMVYCHEWVQITDGAFKAIRLTPDLSATVGEPILLFHASASRWTKRETNYRNAGKTPGVVSDGPWMHRTKNGTLQLLWASWSKDRDYATAIATSESGTLAGPWKQTAEPLLQDDRGHGALFRDFTGRLHLIVHRYFRQPATRVQIYSLDETDSGFSIRARVLGAP